MPVSNYSLLTDLIDNSFALSKNTELRVRLEKALPDLPDKKIGRLQQILLDEKEHMEKIDEDYLEKIENINSSFTTKIDEIEHSIKHHVLDEKEQKNHKEDEKEAEEILEELN